MPPRKVKTQDLMTLMEDGNVRTTGELVDLGFPKYTLGRLVSAGKLVRPAEGLYQLADIEPEPNEEYAAISKRMPGAVMILFTAAVIHGITQVMPGDIWIGLPPAHKHPPRMGDAFGGVEIRALRWSRQLDVEVGVDTIDVRGTSVFVTSPARTVVDMWRYSVLNPSLRSHHARVDEETFLDCIANYLSPEIGGTPAELGNMASAVGVLEGMMPHIKIFGHVRTMAR